MDLFFGLCVSGLIFPLFWGLVGLGFFELILPLFFGVGSGCFSFFDGEFDPGSGRTLAACLTHASRTMMHLLGCGLVANG